MDRCEPDFGGSPGRRDGWLTLDHSDRPITQRRGPVRLMAGNQGIGGPTHDDFRTTRAGPDQSSDRTEGMAKTKVGWIRGKLAWLAVMLFGPERPPGFVLKFQVWCCVRVCACGALRMRRCQTTDRRAAGSSGPPLVSQR
jgi:hypothetical protein